MGSSDGRTRKRTSDFPEEVLDLFAGPARGMTQAEADAVQAEVVARQSRPLASMYPVVFFDALRVKIRDDAMVRSRAVYLALAVLPDGSRDIHGIWIEQTEGATFWMKVFSEHKSGGRQDILIAV